MTYDIYESLESRQSNNDKVYPILIVFFFPKANKLMTYESLVERQ
jgi:hypothetical protein